MTQFVLTSVSANSDTGCVGTMIVRANAVKGIVTARKHAIRVLSVHRCIIRASMAIFIPKSPRKLFDGVRISIIIPKTNGLLPKKFVSLSKPSFILAMAKACWYPIAQMDTDVFFEENRDSILAAWFELLRMQTIGSDPAHLGDCARCTAWLKRYLRPLGFASEVILTDGGMPLFLATREGDQSAPSVLFYGHYDVQPADPLELWETPPFEPTLKDGRVFARGAQDNKGQFFAFIQGLRALIESGARTPSITILLEGEEESGSVHLAAELANLRRRIGAQVLMACDTEVAPDGRPAIVAGLRGVIHMTATVSGAPRDLHSGTHGGVAPNPAMALARMLATMHDEDGRIIVEGFTRIHAPTDAERELASAGALDDAGYEAATGVAPTGGERGLPAWERAGFRPTIEVNGLHGGYGGPGSKTIIPSSAFAKISARLVPGQSPKACADAIAAHLGERCPEGLRFEVSEVQATGGALRLPVASPLCRMATEVITRMDPRGPVFQWDGASMPIVAGLAAASGATPLLVGFGEEGDRIHAPNESYSLAQFRKTMRYAFEMLSELAG